MPFCRTNRKSIYEVPSYFEDQKIASVLERELKLPKKFAQNVWLEENGGEYEENPQSH